MLLSNTDNFVSCSHLFILTLYINERINFVGYSAVKLATGLTEKSPPLLYCMLEQSNALNIVDEFHAPTPAYSQTHKTNAHINFIYNVILKFICVFFFCCF